MRKSLVSLGLYIPVWVAKITLLELSPFPPLPLAG